MNVHYVEKKNIYKNILIFLIQVCKMSGIIAICLVSHLNSGILLLNIRL